ncbi:hypothetical protein SUGI_0024590 [Cryptomeria japonica]|nr:hypothetical protein SUGI_0024590 [Cryptomeria japonica]
MDGYPCRKIRRLPTSMMKTFLRDRMGKLLVAGWQAEVVVVVEVDMDRVARVVAMGRDGHERGRECDNEGSSTVPSPSSSPREPST